MIWLYNLFRTLSRGAVGGVVGTLTAGKAEPFGIKLEEAQAVALAGGLAVFAFLCFCAESWAKRRSGV